MYIPHHFERSEARSRNLLHHSIFSYEATAGYSERFLPAEESQLLLICHSEQREESHPYK